VLNTVKKERKNIAGGAPGSMSGKNIDILGNRRRN